MQQWEYLVLSGPNVNEEELNRLGEEGWELVAAGTFSVYLKRPKN
jgi:hypothetical protein